MAPTVNCSIPGKVERTKVKIFDFVKTSEKHKYIVQAWRGLLKGENQKKQGGRDGGPLSNQGGGKEQAPSVQGARLKRSSKQQVKSCSDPGNCQTGWGLRAAEAGIRNTEQHWKVRSTKAAICSTHPSLAIPLYHISCKRRWPQGRLWRQSTTGTPFSSTFVWQ